MSAARRREVICNSIFETVRRYNRKSRFVGQAFGTPTGLTESHILVEIDAHPGLSLGELAASLKLDLSTLSRSVKGLIRQGLLNEVSDKRDQRMKRLGLTPAAIPVLKQLDAAANEHLKSFVNNLSPAELKEFQDCTRMMLDRHGTPPVAHRSSELPILSEMRRLSRAWGVIGRSFLGSGYSATYWQLVSEIKARRAGITASELQDLLGLSATAVSLSLKRLRNEDLVRSQAAEIDQRTKTLHLTREGEKFTAKLSKAGTDWVHEGVEDFSSDQLQHYAKLFAKYVDEELLEDGTLVDTQWKVKLLESPQARARARGELIEALVRQGLHYKSPALLVGEGNPVYVLEQGDVLTALCEFYQGKKNLFLHQLQPLKDSLSEGELEQFFIECSKALLKLTGKRSVHVKESHAREALALRLGGVKDSRGIKLSSTLGRSD